MFIYRLSVSERILKRIVDSDSGDNDLDAAILTFVLDWTGQVFTLSRFMVDVVFQLASVLWNFSVCLSTLDRV
jgi:hypothetical protein